MKVTFTGAGPQTSASFVVSDPGNQWQNKSWHAFISGTFGTGANLQIEYSPDPGYVSDANSRWFSPAVLLFSSGGDTWFEARPRKFRYYLTGGDSTNNIVAEIV